MRAPALARLVLLVGLAFAAAASVFLILIISDGAEASGAPGAGGSAVRIVSVSALLLIGALMLARLPAHPLGWIFAIAGVTGTIANAAAEYAVYSHVVRELPAGVWAGWLSEWLGMSILIPAVGFLLFPDGRPRTAWARRWLWVGLIGSAAITVNGILGPGENLAFQANPFLSDATAEAVAGPFGIGWLMAIAATAAGVAGLVAQGRVAEGEAREQLHTVLVGARLVTFGFAACFAGALIAPDALDLGAFVFTTSLSALAIAMGVAILRHRLYGLDVFIDRTLVLTGTTVVLGALYAAAITGAAALLDEQVKLEVTLPAAVLVAVALAPVRDRLQTAVNRLLHGQRDEPYAAVTTLGRRLGETLAPEEILPVMVQTIADALRLPYVAVELAGDSVPAAAHGAPAAGVALRLPLVHAGERVGTLLIGARAHGTPLDEADRRLLEEFATRASAAASAVSLSVDLQRSREHLVAAREEERRRLRADLHDGLGPSLAGTVLTIDAARRMLITDPAGADALLDRAAANVEASVADMRRVVYGLRPPALDQLGLVGALRQHALAIDTPQLTCDVIACDPFPELPAAAEVAAFRIAQEALTNVVRHSGAHRATVTLGINGALQLEVHDDGTGIPENYMAGVGLTSMRERATELGGTFAVLSSPRSGTTIDVSLPLAPR